MTKADAELMKKLQEEHGFNPWLDVANTWLRKASGSKYVLPEDRKKVKEYEKRLSDKENTLPDDKSYYHFVLNPCAPIWVLLKNPGFSSADVYDLSSIRSGKSRLLQEGISKEQILTISNRTHEEALKKRRELVCDQLRFKFDDDDKAFYILRDEFKTIGNRAKGNKTLGGYNWYTKYFCCESSYATLGNKCLKDLSRNVFVLECIPYHSKQFFDSEVRFKHHELWEKLICHALGKKILIMRRYIYKRIMDMVSADSKLMKRFVKAEENRKIVVFRNRKANLTLPNTYWPCSTSQNVNPLLRIKTSRV